MDCSAASASEPQGTARFRVARAPRTDSQHSSDAAFSSEAVEDLNDQNLIGFVSCAAAERCAFVFRSPAQISDGKTRETDGRC